MGDAQSIAELTAPPLAAGLRPLWLLFVELRQAVRPQMPIGLADMAHWQTLMRCELQPFEVQAVLMIDALWRAKD